LKKAGGAKNRFLHRKTTLGNGVRVVTEKIPFTNAVSAGIWLCAGSRDEKEDQMGIAHMVEHLVFKGTRKRSTYQIAQVMESRGGDLNAFTTRESVCFYTSSLNKDLKLSLDVLMDLVCHATFPLKEFDTEKGVILQEIAMSFDDHEEYIFDLFSEKIYRDHPMGWPILGTEKSVQGIERKHIRSFYKKYFRGENIIVSVVGNVDHDEVVKAIRPILGKIEKRSPILKRTKPKFHHHQVDYFRDIEQTHVLVGFEAPDLKDPLRFASFILSTALGGGMTSILYQKIREKKGLAYTVYSTISNATDSGLMMIYAGTEPDKKDDVLEIIQKEIRKIKRNGFDKNMLERYKTQIRGYLLLNDDDLESRMNSLCLNEMLFGKYRSISDTVESIEKTYVKDIHKLLDEYVDINKMSYMTLGPDKN